MKNGSVRIADYKGTSGHLQETSHSSVSTVENVSVRIADYSGTSRVILETSHASLSNVENVSLCVLMCLCSPLFLQEHFHSVTLAWLVSCMSPPLLFFVAEALDPAVVLGTI